LGYTSKWGEEHVKIEINKPDSKERIKMNMEIDTTQNISSAHCINVLILLPNQMDSINYKEILKTYLQHVSIQAYHLRGAIEHKY
jgi:hypothetical protein